MRLTSNGLIRILRILEQLNKVCVNYTVSSIQDLIMLYFKMIKHPVVLLCFNSLHYISAK